MMGIQAAPGLLGIIRQIVPVRVDARRRDAALDRLPLREAKPWPLLGLQARDELGHDFRSGL